MLKQVQHDEGLGRSKALYDCSEWDDLSACQAVACAIRGASVGILAALRRPGILLLLPVLLALAARTFVAPGWMIESDASGSITVRSEEHTSELQSLMRISYAVFCLKKKTKPTNLIVQNTTIH